MGGDEFLVGDAPFLSVEAAGVEDDVLGVGAELGGESAFSVEAEEQLVGVPGEDGDGAFVLGKDVFPVAAEAKSLEIHAQGWRERDFCGGFDGEATVAG